MIKKNRLKKVIFLFKKYLFYLIIKQKNKKFLKIKIKRKLRRETKKVNTQYVEALNSFFCDLPLIENQLRLDLETYLEHDPACKGINEVLLTYPGFEATMIYRLANALYCYDIALIPRFLSEIGHQMTGIDIHPGAIIGSSLFIDHGTGIVIGETAEIGSHFKVYQGVTIGAKYIDQSSKGNKRHPTIKNNVTVYANSLILGGSTVIEDNVIIGCCNVITSSITKNSIIKNKNY